MVKKGDSNPEKAKTGRAAEYVPTAAIPVPAVMYETDYKKKRYEELYKDGYFLQAIPIDVLARGRFHAMETESCFCKLEAAFRSNGTDNKSAKDYDQKILETQNALYEEQKNHRQTKADLEALKSQMRNLKDALGGICG